MEAENAASVVRVVPLFEQLYSEQVNGPLPPWPNVCFRPIADIQRFLRKEDDPARMMKSIKEHRAAIRAFLLWFVTPFLLAALASGLFGLSFWGSYAIAFTALVANGLIAEYADDW